MTEPAPGDAATPPPSLTLYHWLNRSPWPASFTGKVFLVAFLTTHTPLVAVLAVLALHPGAVSLPAVVGVIIVATVAGAALSLWALQQLLRPLLLADRALDRYLECGEHVMLPTTYGDACGRLLRNVAVTIATFETHRRDLEQRANHDLLTGLPNRRAAAVRLENADRIARGGPPVCLALLDLDHFKAVNDRYGHAAGDRVLVTLGGVLRDTLRPTGWAARWGGDEFLLVLEAPLAEALTVLEEVRRQLATRRRPAGDHPAPVTISAGVAALTPEGGPAGCLRAADRALYRAKAAGGNRVLAAGAADAGAEGSHPRE